MLSVVKCKRPLALYCCSVRDLFARILANANDTCLRAKYAPDPLACAPPYAKESCDKLMQFPRLLRSPIMASKRPSPNSVRHSFNILFKICILAFATSTYTCPQTSWYGR